MTHFLRFSTMLKLLPAVFALGILSSFTPAASAFTYVDGWTYEPVTQYENYNYNKVIYDSPEEYWIKSSPYYSTTHALHPYWRSEYAQGYRPYTPSFIRSDKFANYLVDAYERGYLGSLAGTQPLDLPRSPALQSRCVNYTVKKRAAQLPSFFETCDDRRAGLAPTPVAYPYGY